VDVRLIAATNRDLADAVRAGRFREDLFYRLNVFPLHVPPLRQRGDDVCRLAEAFVERFSRVHRLGRKRIADGDADLLRSHNWPGNVRELQNAIERAMILSGRDGPLSLAQVFGGSAAAERTIDTVKEQASRILTAADLEQIERENLIRALEHCGWKISGDGGAAALLGIPPSTFSSKMKALGINRRA
jgi:transcriptional regulator with GAF, ATPase, and Fis domain